MTSRTRELFDASHGRSGRSDERADDGFEPLDRLPRPVVEPGLVPPVDLESGVVGLPLVEVGGEERAGGRPPVFVGGDHVGGAVVVGDLELGEQAEPFAVDVAQHVPLEEAAPPAVGHDRAEHVLAVGQQRGDVVRVVADPVGVARPAGRQHVIADDHPVEVDAVHAGRRDVRGAPARWSGPARSNERRRNGDGACRSSGSMVGGVIHVADQSSGSNSPASIANGSLHGDSTPSLSPHPNAHGGSLTGDERVAGPVDEDGGVRVDAAERDVVDLDLVARLPPRRRVGVGDPRQAWRAVADAQRLAELGSPMLGAKASNSAHVVVS